MSTTDTVTKEFISDNEVFADVVNFLIFDGEKVVTPDSLVEMDSTSVAVPYGTDNSGTPVQKERDVVKNVTCKMYSDMVFAIVGIENQTSINYAMPVRNMLYDALTYTGQVEKAGKSYRKEKVKLSGAEFLSHFKKEDKLIPVITLVINFSPDKWEAPVSLYEMIDFKSDILKKFVPDYWINVIEPASLTKEQLKKFTTGFREVMECIKYSEDMYAMQQALSENERFKNLDRKTSNVLRYCSKLKIDFDIEEETMDMCKAFEDYKNLGKSEGIEIGKSEGIEIGKSEGIEIGKSEGIKIGKSEGIEIGKNEGIEIGRNEGLTRFATYLIKNNVDIHEIISQTGLSADDIMKIKSSMM
ncbi:MAG: transposase [Oscillospiraceae bacterium]|nr:transposase [Oscillospiraceae bacterium]